MGTKTDLITIADLTQQQTMDGTTTADVDLNSDSSPLQVDISDALSEKDKVKFTVHTRLVLRR